MTACQAYAYVTIMSSQNHAIIKCPIPKLIRTYKVPYSFIRYTASGKQVEAAVRCRPVGGVNVRGAPGLSE